MQICTHSGSFHADDVIGVAILKSLYTEAKIVRSRDPSIWSVSDFLVDVGGKLEWDNNLFDHHQLGFSEKRENGNPYAGAGLVWKKFGKNMISSIFPSFSEKQLNETFNRLDLELIQYVDCLDTGIEVPGPIGFNLSGLLSSFNPNWFEYNESVDEKFLEAVELTKILLKNAIKYVASEVMAAEIVRGSHTIDNGQILIMDQASIPFTKVICEEMPHVLFVVYPESTGTQWQVRTVPVHPDSFVARKDLPKSWAGLRGEDLDKATGLCLTVFCHNGRFICGSHMKETAIKMAKIALKTEL